METTPFYISCQFIMCMFTVLQFPLVVMLSVIPLYWSFVPPSVRKSPLDGGGV